MPKGYWIKHVEEILDQGAPDRDVMKANALIKCGEFKTVAIGPVEKLKLLRALKK